MPRWVRAATIIGLVTVAACEIEIDECGRKKSRDSCNNAKVDNIGHCYWVEVSTHRIVDGQCERSESHGECVGISGTQQGCSPVSCPGDVDGEGAINAYFRPKGDDAVELFENPECGPTPQHGGWSECGPEDLSECACLCGDES